MAGGSGMGEEGGGRDSFNERVRVKGEGERVWQRRGGKKTASVVRAAGSKDGS